MDASEKYRNRTTRVASNARVVLTLIGLFVSCSAEAQEKAGGVKSRPIVNQAGYNLHEAKRFICYGAPEGAAFTVIDAEDSLKAGVQALYKGVIRDFAGDFSDFNPSGSGKEYMISVKGHGQSYPFGISEHLMEKRSSRLAYQFFIDVRGSEDPVFPDESKIAGGGPSRDGGAYTLETVFEVLLYASNPSLFQRWHDDFGNKEVPDLISLMLWHAEFAYHHRDYNGPRGHGSYLIGYPDWDKLQTYDYQNTLDHLAAACAAYHSFLRPYLDEAKYRHYRQACLQNWEAYDRDRVVRYYVKSEKWVDKGWQEFNEMGNVFGQAVFRNLFMYLCEKEEEDGQPEKFLGYAQQAAADIIQNWDFENPRHMWWIRNGEHITPQALAFFLMVAPEAAPKGTLEKLKAWAAHMKARTGNFWHYRKHSAVEWAHPQTKELGNAGLGGSMFAAAYLLDDPELRAIGWSQVNQVFGLNPAEAHYSNKSEERVAMNGYWEGIERGWPYAHPNGAGELGKVRGTLDGTPLDNMFPYHPEAGIEGVSSFYATEGWAVSNRAWMSTVIFATLDSHEIRFTDQNGQQIKTANGKEKIRVELKAALNLDPDERETATVDLYLDDAFKGSLALQETGPDTGLFEGFAEGDFPEGSKLGVSYGYLGFDKIAELILK
ncbi:hypothetical protein [Parapedobacter tibetensis]|uniref:hypothetical protein n=1 Tax=Parapedobacter tibetensis TaxID=2972951 RepID=UPI00214D8869|nr:hypothetical protein [Parapedobacter tibetensis]